MSKAETYQKPAYELKTLLEEIDALQAALPPPVVDDFASRLSMESLANYRAQIECELKESNDVNQT